MHIAERSRGHLQALNLAHPALWVEHKDIEIGHAAKSGDGGRAGIARSGGDNSGTPPAFGQRAGEHPPQQLHRHILEGKCGAVKQLQQVEALPQIDQRGDGRGFKAGIGCSDIGPQGIGRETAIRKAGEDGEGCFPIRTLGERSDLRLFKYRPGGGQEQPAIGSRTSQQNIGKGLRGGLPPGADKIHLSKLSSTSRGGFP